MRFFNSCKRAKNAEHVDVTEADCDDKWEAEVLGMSQRSMIKRWFPMGNMWRLLTHEYSSDANANVFHAAMLVPTISDTRRGHLMAHARAWLEERGFQPKTTAAWNPLAAVDGDDEDSEEHTEGGANAMGHWFKLAGVSKEGAIRAIFYNLKHPYHANSSRVVYATWLKRLVDTESKCTALWIQDLVFPGFRLPRQRARMEVTVAAAQADPQGGGAQSQWPLRGHQGARAVVREQLTERMKRGASPMRTREMLGAAEHLDTDAVELEDQGADSDDMDTADYRPAPPAHLPTGAELEELLAPREHSPTVNELLELSGL